MNTLQSLKEFFLIPVEFFHHATKLTYCALAIAATIGFLWFKIIFRKQDNIDESSTIVLIRATERRWTRWKFTVLLMVCIGSYLLAYRQLPDWLPTFFQGVLR